MRYKPLTKFVPGTLVWYRDDIGRGPMLLLLESTGYVQGSYPHIKLLRKKTVALWHITAERRVILLQWRTKMKWRRASDGDGKGH